MFNYHRRNKGNDLDHNIVNARQFKHVDAVRITFVPVVMVEAFIWGGRTLYSASMLSNDEVKRYSSSSSA
jgi:hypothetical protein